MTDRRKILYVDLDNTLVHFKSGIDRLGAADFQEYQDRFDEAPGIFALMDPIEGAIDAFTLLAAHFDAYILSTAPWKNPSAWSDKLLWVQKHFGVAADSVAYKRLILSHHKNLNHGDFLVDDRDHNGAKDFTGKLVKFGSTEFPDWNAVTKHLLASKGH